MRITIAVVPVMVMVMAAPAVADERYAGDVVLVDAVSLGATLSGTTQEQPLVLGVGIAGGVLGAPLVHLAHDNPRGALKSLALRTLPIAAGLLGGKALETRSLCACGHEPYVQPGAVLGFTVGLVIASAVDATSFAKERSKRAVWMPDVAIGQGGARVSLGATF